MTVQTRPPPSESAPGAPKRPAYDSGNLHPLDQECRKFDPDDSIDYDEILATTEDDWLARNYKRLNSDEGTTKEEFLRVMQQWTDEELGRK